MSAETSEQPDPMEMEEQLKLRMWAGEYYEQGRPIVRLLADLAIEAARKVVS